MATPQKKSGPSQNQPTQAPNTAETYERANPDRESESGTMKDDRSGSPPQEDKGKHTVPSRSKPAELDEGIDHQQRRAAQKGETSGGSASSGAAKVNLPKASPTGSMKDEEPLGSDQRPLEATRGAARRQPRPNDAGGTK